jgi:putative oxidoreductase
MKRLRTNTDLGLAVLRVTTGAIFVAHGAQKLFVYGLDGVAGGFAQMGIPFPALVGPVVALLEFFGGLALMTGLLTRLVSAGLAINMLGAFLLVHLPAGFFLPNGYEFVLLLGASAIALTLSGAGRYSIDAVLGRRRLGASPAEPRELRRAA